MIKEFLNKITPGDCLKLLKKIPSNSIDLIFADPPYNLQLRNDLYRTNQTKVDASTALQNTLDEYETRMPPEKMKEVGHANKLAGGIDNK